MVRRFLAATLTGGALLAAAAPASAQPCIDSQTRPGVWFCVLPESGPAFRGFSGGFYTGDSWYVVGVGCYYPGGSPRYYVVAASGPTGSRTVVLPVGGVPCV